MAVLTSPHSRLTHFFFWAFIFSGLLLVTRLGYLAWEVIDWDESTFIIISSHVRAGHLPYLELFDIKPPFMFFALAGVMSLFGENLITVRFFGAFCLLVAALACYGIAVRRNSSLAAGVSTAVFLVLAGSYNFQSTMTEHLVVALLLPACWLLVAHSHRLESALMVGLLLSLATLTRTNIAFVVLALGAYYAWQLLQPSKSVPRFAFFAYCAGGFVPLLVLLAVYAYVGGLGDLFLSNITVPLSYASSQGGLLEVLQSHIRIWKGSIDQYRAIFLPATFFIGFTIYAAMRRIKSLSNDEFLLLLVVTATFFSVLMNGQPSGHHQLQIIPLLAVLAPYGLKGTFRNTNYIFAGLTIIAGIVHFGPASVSVVRDWSRREARYDLLNVAKLIQEHGAIDKSVYAPVHHLVYWYLGPGSLPSRMVHPSNFAKDDIMNPLVEHGYIPQDELKRIWSSRLGYVVVGTRKPWYFTDEEYQAFNAVLARDFELWQRVGSIDVFRRKI